jgi:hypothetical protein
VENLRAHSTIPHVRQYLIGPGLIASYRFLNRGNRRSAVEVSKHPLPHQKSKISNHHSSIKNPHNKRCCHTPGSVKNLRAHSTNPSARQYNTLPPAPLSSFQRNKRPTKPQKIRQISGSSILLFGNTKPPPRCNNPEETSEGGTRLREAPELDAALPRARHMFPQH